MRQNQKEQLNMEHYKTITELIDKIKEDDCDSFIIHLIEDNANKLYFCSLK